MDLTQRKLNKSEWESIEVPVSEAEKEVLRLIINGTDNVNIKYNMAISLFTYLKVDNNSDMEDYLFVKYFNDKLTAFCKLYNKYNDVLTINISSNPKIKKADLIRLERSESGKIPLVYETLLLDILEKLLKFKSTDDVRWLQHYFTLFKLSKNTITNINRHIKTIVSKALSVFEDDINMVYMIENAVEYIEKNELLLKHADMMLYEHQKEIFTVMKNPYFKKRLAKFRLEMDKDVSDDDEDTEQTVFRRDEPIPTD